MKAIVVYVPESHVEAVKEAMFAAGAGRVGQYESCSWTVLGEGQFKPLAGSDPFIGQVGKLEKVNEYRVEMVCAAPFIKEVIAAMRAVHPYETPAFLVLDSQIQ